MMLDDAGFDRNDKISGREPVKRQESPPSSCTTGRFRSMETLVTRCCMTGLTVRWT